MTVRKLMLATGSCLVMGALLAPSVVAQESEAIETVVVTGIRGSLAKSATIKRDSKQIVDVITAEDVGKLPDNNVVEALAHVTGVQIYRTHGEGSGLAIRGMTDVQTTLNGNDTSTGTARSMNLSDVPAELLKSVTVYKTRTADQVEGGIAGSVNVDLRRPLDLPEGWTVAGSLRGVNSSIGNTWSPYGSLLTAYRTDTSIGEVGFLINLSYTQNNYFENFIESESPGIFFDKDLASLPSSQKAVIAPYAVNYGVEQGTTTRPSISVSTQWKPTENLDFVLEGSFFSGKDQLHRDRLHMFVRNGSYNLSNVTLTDDGATVKSLTETSASGGTVNGGPETYLTTTNNSTGSLNFETHWHDGRWQVNFGSQYNWSASKYYLLGLYTRFPDATSVNVDFDSDMVKGGGPYVEYNNVDMTDLSEYTIMQLHDEVGHNRSKQWSGQIDGAYHVSDAWYVRDFTFGVRATGRRNSYDYGYRDWTFNNTSGTSQYIPASSFPVCSDSYNLISPDVSGVNSPSWYRISASCVKKNFTAVRQGIITNLGKGTTAANRWETSQPPNTDLAQSYSDHEYTFGGYAQMTLGTTLFGMPVDGLAGVRVVNTWGDSNTIATTVDKDGKSTDTENKGTGNYVDVLPNANAVFHFTDKLQLRLSYAFSVQRPNFRDSSYWRVVEVNNKKIYEGSPNLQPMRENSWDASIEYFFGKSGQLSAGYYLKKPHGWLFYSCQEVHDIPEFDGANGTVCKNRNSGPGNFEGFEFTAQSFFDFLPGFWSNFGASANATLLSAFKVLYPYEGDVAGVPGIYDAMDTSRYTYNLALYYDTPEFSTRLAYNYRARYRSWVNTDYVQYSPYVDPTSRLDLAINYTPYKFVTFSIEGSNLLKNNTRTWYGKENLLPYGLRMSARTIQFSIRMRN